MDLTNTKRQAVVEEARSWLGTPFHDCAGVKGAGVDCAHFLLRVYVAVGLVEDFTPPPYPPQWFIHRDVPLFLNTVAKYAHQVEVPDVGDIVMLKFGRHAAHGAIILDERTIIHALKQSGRVTTDSLAQYADRIHSYWSVF